MILRLFFILLCLLSSICYAKNINLYDQPKNDAKVVGTVDSDNGIIPIFTPKEGSWIKVGDPRNGNVGWIKSSDLSTSGFTFSTHVISTGKGPGTYQLIQFGQPSQQMTSEQAQEMMKKIKARQQMIQQDTQKMMQDMFKNIDQQMSNFPMIMPVIVVPAQSTAASPKK